jgi:hypothetical protein
MAIAGSATEASSESTYKNSSQHDDPERGGRQSGEQNVTSFRRATVP